jgi:hypothetical protein
MVDTFTCDSCGMNNVPVDDKQKLLIKRTVATGLTTKRGKTAKATVTQGMEVCPDCITFGIVRNRLKVNKENQPERNFTWMPREDMASTFEWGQRDDQAEASKIPAR